MAINMLKVKMFPAAGSTTEAHDISFGSEVLLNDLGIESIQILFNGHFQLEVRQKSTSDVIVIMTSGGVSRELDLATFQHLITMNY